MSTLHPTIQSIYRSYLLRIWQTPGQDGRWHATLERIGDGGRVGFASLDELAAFLQAEGRDPGPARPGGVDHRS